MLAKFSDASRTWKRANVFQSDDSTVTVCFDGYADMITLPIARVKPVPAVKAQHAKKGAGKKAGHRQERPARMPLQPATQLPKPSSLVEEVLCTVRACLSKLTPDNFEKIAAKVVAVELDSAVALGALVDLMFERAVVETHFTHIYARLFSHCAQQMPSFEDDNGALLTFRRLLLNKTQREFESDRGSKRQLTDEERKRKLGATLFVGHLWQQGLLRDSIVHGCVSDVLNTADADSGGVLQTDAVEVACTLVTVIGAACDVSSAGCAQMNLYMARMATWVADKNRLMPARIRFKVMDVLDARKKRRDGDARRD